MSKRLQRLWDAGENHIKRHPRRYAVLGAVTFNPAYGADRWVDLESAPSRTDIEAYVQTPMGLPDLPDFSWWNLTTTPLGLLLLFLAWRNSRPRRGTATSGQTWESEVLEELNKRDDAINDAPTVQVFDHSGSVMAGELANRIRRFLESSGWRVLTATTALPQARQGRLVVRRHQG